MRSIAGVKSAMIAICIVGLLQTLIVVRDVSADEVVAKYVTDLGSKNQGVRQRAKDELLVIGKSAVPQIMAALDDSDASKKYTAIFLLGQLKAAEAVPRLLEELANTDEAHMQIRLGSAFALGLIGDARALAPLAGMLLQGNDEMTRGVALMALGYLKNSAAVPAVRAVLTDPEQQLRIAAATALGMIGNNEGLQVAIDGTKSADQTAVVTSIQALGIIGDNQALPRLGEMSSDPNLAWKSDVRLAVKQIEYANTAAESKIEFLRGAMTDANTEVVEWAITTLADLGSPEAVAILHARVEAMNDKAGGIAKLKLRILDQGAPVP